MIIKLRYERKLKGGRICCLTHDSNSKFFICTWFIHDYKMLIAFNNEGAGES